MSVALSGKRRRSTFFGTGLRHVHGVISSVTIAQASLKFLGIRPSTSAPGEEWIGGLQTNLTVGTRFLSGLGKADSVDLYRDSLACRPDREGVQRQGQPVGHGERR